MGSSAFGAPITHLTLKKMEEYEGYVPTLYDMAVVAFERKNDGRDTRAREFVEEQRKAFGLDSTLCLIYNATGDAMTIETYSDRTSLTVGKCPYPTVIANGQWGVFLERGGGAVVYKVRNATGMFYQVAFIFDNRAPARCHTEIREANYFKPKDAWPVYGDRLEADPTFVSQAHENGVSSFASIGGGTLSPVFEGIVTLKNAWSRYLPRPGISVRPFSALVDQENDPAPQDNAEAPKNGN